jgi:hypothetical protein
MKGLSGTTASLQAGVHGSMQAAGLAVGTGLTVAGAAATFGGSAAAHAAIEGTKFAAREIAQQPLDAFVICNLPIAFKSGNTTVLFPSAISGLYAKSIAIQEQPNADFLISFTPGTYYFTVRALKREDEDHLTVYRWLPDVPRRKRSDP